MYLYLQKLGYLNLYKDVLLAGWPGFHSWQCKIVILSTVSRLTLGLTQPSIQLVRGALSLGLN
jgi:hypothetical protein